MRKDPAHRFLRAPALSAVFLAAFLPGWAAGEEKIKVEDLVARHLAAIGSPGARAAAKNRIASGTVNVVHRMGGHGSVAGGGQLLSEGHKVRLELKFNDINYSGEQIISDGENVNVGQLGPGQRSPLSAFIFSFDVIVKEGLLGGVLSAGWPLLDLAGRQPKLEYSALKKIDGRQMYEVKYKAKKGAGELQVALYFDPQSFRHIRTQYRLTRPAPMAANPMSSGGELDSVYTLWEVFDNFKEFEGLSLPLTYKLIFTIDDQKLTVMSDWDFSVAQLAHNQPIDAKSFLIK
jgi:hypothetical protein